MNRSPAQRRARQVTAYGAMLAAILGVLVADLFQPALADAANAMREILPASAVGVGQEPGAKAALAPVPPRPCGYRRFSEGTPRPLTD